MSTSMKEASIPDSAIDWHGLRKTIAAQSSEALPVISWLLMTAEFPPTLRLAGHGLWSDLASRKEKTQCVPAQRKISSFWYMSLLDVKWMMAAQGRSSIWTRRSTISTALHLQFTDRPQTTAIVDKSKHDSSEQRSWNNRHILETWDYSSIGWWMIQIIWKTWAIVFFIKQRYIATPKVANSWTLNYS